MIVVLNRKKRSAKPKNKNNTTFFKNQFTPKKWQKRILWPARTLRRRSWRLLKSSNSIRLFMNLRRRRGLFHRWYHQKVKCLNYSQHLPTFWTKKPFYTKRFRRTLNKASGLKYLWKRTTFPSRSFYKTRVKRRFGRLRRRHNLFRRLKTLKTSFFQKNVRRRFTKKLIRRRKLIKKFRFRSSRGTLSSYLGRRSRRLVASWRTPRIEKKPTKTFFTQVPFFKKPVRFNKKILLRHGGLFKKPRYTPYYLFESKPYKPIFNFINKELANATFSLWVYKSLYTSYQSLDLPTLWATSQLRVVSELRSSLFTRTQPSSFFSKGLHDGDFLCNSIIHSKVLQRSLVETNRLHTTLKKVNASSHKSPENVSSSKRLEKKPMKVNLQQRKVVKRRRMWRKSSEIVRFKNSNVGWRRTSQFTTTLLKLNKFAFLNKCNRFFIRSLKLKLSFYRIPILEFVNSYMIRLLPKHFKWRTNVWNSQVNHPSRNLFKVKLLDSFKLYLIKDPTTLTCSKSLKSPLTGSFNLIKLLQNSLFLGSLWNRRLKRPLKRRRTRHLVRFFHKSVVADSQLTSALSPLKSTRVDFRESISSSQGGSNLWGLVKILCNNRTADSILFLPHFVLKYLTLNHFSTLPEEANWVKKAFKPWSDNLSSHYFVSGSRSYTSSNLSPVVQFRKTLNRKLLKLFKFHRFSRNVTMWYYNMLIRFLENCTGRKVYIKFNPFLENYVSFGDSARCAVWLGRIRSFQRILGPKIFLHESLKILCISIRSKDPTLLAGWLRGMLYRLSFWKYRILFRYLKFLLRYLFSPQFSAFGFRGFKLRLKGKISVAGNARTRTLQYSVGETSYSKFDHRVVSDFNTINTFTGVLGFRIWFFF